MNIHKYDKIVVGSDLTAMVYSINNGIPLILNKIQPPKFFETLSNGKPKLYYWEKLCFLLSLSGLLPMSDKVSSIRVDGELLKIATKNSRMIKIRFQDLILFDDENVHGIEIKSNNLKYKVLDWFDIRTGGKHDIDFLETQDDFVREVYFYPTERMSGNHQNKDLVAISYLTKEQLNDIEYSDLYARYKILSMMRKAGIKGARNGRDVNNPHKYKYYLPKIESSGREIFEIKKDHRVSSSKNIKFLNLDCEEMLRKWEERPLKNYCTKLDSMVH